MLGFPQELLFALVFGAVWLAQTLYKRYRMKAEAMKADAEARNDIQATTVPRTRDPTTQGVGAVGAPQPIAVSRAAPADVATISSPRARSPARRFSRRGLMPDQRAVQDAIVIAAILQPCHAHRPHDQR